MNATWSGRALDAARKAKHAWLLTRIAAHEEPRKALSKVQDTYYRPRYEGHTYEFRPGQFRRSFVNWNAPAITDTPQSAPRRVYCFWTGPNGLTPPRLESLERMRQMIGMPVVLVTPENLGEVVVAEHPLHPAYEFLSYVHRSDYLRAYVMHHHGGGYSDIKVPQGDWSPAFDQLNEDASLHMIGYPERTSLWIGKQAGRLGRELRRRHHTLPGGSAFVVRPQTELSTEWLVEVERRISYHADALAQHPGGIKGEDPCYPISWNRLLAQVLHPLALKHHAHVRVRADLTPSIANQYR